MNANVRAVLRAILESLEAAAGYALLAAGIYAVLFVDVTGRGSLWQTLRHVNELSALDAAAPTAARTVKVSPWGGPQKVHEDDILAVFDDKPRNGPIEAMYQTPESIAARPAGRLAPVPADPKARKRDVKGGTFTTYGEKNSVASQAAEGSPARVKTTALARPGVGAGLSRGLVSGSEAARSAR